MKALIVGGGLAGMSAAISLAQDGYGVHLVEQRPVWSARVCGSFMSPEAARHLERLGLGKELSKFAAPVRYTRVLTPFGFEKRLYNQNENRPGFAWQRQQLEKALFEAADSRGVELNMGVRMLRYEKLTHGWQVELQKGGQRVKHFVDLLILADGRFSLGHAKSENLSSGWYGFNATFRGVPQNPGEQSIHFFPGGYVGVITYANQSTNVCGLVRRRHSEKIDWETVLAESRRSSRTLIRLLKSSFRESDWHGVGPLPFGVYVDQDGPLRVGDAAAVGDPFMGEGIGRALAAGPMIQAAIRLLGTDRIADPRLIALHASLWNRSYRRRWQWGSTLRWMMAHSITFRALEVAIQAPAFLSTASRVFHTGFDPAHA